VALTLQQAQVETTLTLTPAQVQGVVDLSDATVATFCDTRSAWPAKLRLDGFAYRRVEGDADDGARQDWLARHVDANGERAFAPRAYEQLAATYRATGEDGAARAVAIARARAHREHLPSDLRGWARRGWSRFLAITVGYGYRPWQALIWLAVLWAPLAWLIDRARDNGAMRLLAGDPAERPELVPGIYALDVLVPVVEFGQRAHWHPELPYTWASWAAIVLGWALATALVAGITNVYRRA
jgi:hypothetical protein